MSFIRGNRLLPIKRLLKWQIVLSFTSDNRNDRAISSL
jgi:hypothetical protein